MSRALLIDELWLKFALSRGRSELKTLINFWPEQEEVEELEVEVEKVEKVEKVEEEEEEEEVGKEVRDRDKDQEDEEEVGTDMRDSCFIF